MHHLVIAQVINHQPSCRLTALALSGASFPTQLMAPDSVNMVSHTSIKLSPSKDCLPWNRMTWPGPVTTASVRPDLQSWIMPFTMGACQVCGGGGVAPLSVVEVTWISKQYWVSGWLGVCLLARDWDGNAMGYYQMPPSPWGLLGHLVVWGYGPPSGW